MRIQDILDIIIMVMFVFGLGATIKMLFLVFREYKEIHCEHDIEIHECEDLEGVYYLHVCKKCQIAKRHNPAKKGKRKQVSSKKGV